MEAQSNMQKAFSVLFSHFVKPEQKPAFETVLQEFIDHAKSVKGLESVNAIQPNESTQNVYWVMVCFLDEESYRLWQNSSFFKNWSYKTQKLTEKESEINYVECGEFWVKEPKTSSTETPVKWRMTLLTWLIVYPLILLLSTLFNRYLSFLSPPARLLLISLFLVIVMSNFLVPLLLKWAARFVFVNKL